MRLSFGNTRRTSTAACLLLLSIVSTGHTESPAATGTVADWFALDGSDGSCSDPSPGSINGPWDCGVNAQAHGTECQFLSVSLPPAGTCDAVLVGTTGGLITKVTNPVTGIRQFECLGTGPGELHLTAQGTTVTVPVVIEIEGDGTAISPEDGSTTWVSAATGKFQGQAANVGTFKVATVSGTFQWVCRPVGPSGWTVTTLAFDGHFSAASP